MLERAGFFSCLDVKVNVESIKTVEIPAPTAASVKATSTASIIINNRADSRLKTPDNITVENNPWVLTTAKAVKTSKTKIAIVTKSSI